MVNPNALRIGMGQILVIPGAVDDNLTRAVHMIDEAARQGCAIVVLPECLDVGWTSAMAPALAQPIPGPAAARLAAAAAAAGVMVVAGLTERDGDHLFNAAVLIGSDGAILAKHRKINELDFARKVYHAGTFLQVVETEHGVIGIDICADNAYPSLALGRALAAMGAQILLSPCAWAVPADFDNSVRPYGDEWVTAYGALARETGMPVIGVSNVGPVVGGEWDGWRCIGASLAVGRDGEVVAQAPFSDRDEQLVVVDIALDRP
ncbi:carbon-nitrogen hydrolase family protein [Demequina sp. TTPB684]|uniref:carbon-nitrogen hydrolase family protein n=1 Tax=unclassified Demequina TaxID=2620311 RepID=UPI001CF4DE66|nr:MULTISPECIES: carbon-nitrogen hydrolase family protein [unclassified Demequina]MCB2413421.1 carbon-nitrogen hydrolase family protein [Demequina sp. TTPB684]UPU87984.1 carbon-nitrogen hydrolase family protein [Demequina sp. TMPB413]